MGNEQPFVSAGQGAVQNLSGLLSNGGSLTQGYQNFSAPTGVTMQNDPGYQFQLQQGENAIQNSAAARGGLLSTGTAKTLNNYAQGTASQAFNDVYNRALTSYQTNQGNYNTNNNNTYSRLSGLAGLGANSAGNLNSTLNSGTQAMANNLTGNAQIVGSDLMGVGNSQAAGTIGQANAYGGALTGATGAIGGGLTLSALLGASNASNSSNTYVPSVNNGSFSYSGGTEAGTGYAPAASGAGLWGNPAAYPQAPNDPYAGQLPVGV